MRELPENIGLVWPPVATKLERDAKDGVICSPAVSKLEPWAIGLCPPLRKALPPINELEKQLGSMHQ